jgi:hypothetical protein
MANGLKKNVGKISAKKGISKLTNSPAYIEAKRKMLGMTKRPTTAGQARFGDVDVNDSAGPLSEAEAEMARQTAAMSVGRQPNRRRGALSDREAQIAKRTAGY